MSLEARRPYEAIVVLGKNLGFGWSKDKIRKQREHLAPHGRVNTDAGGILFIEGRTERIIFSSGITVSELPSEAQLMKNHIQRIFPEKIPDEAIILEEVSKQTRGNAIEIAKVLEREKIDPNNVGLVTMGFHMPRAQRFFREQGLNLDPIPSEEVLLEHFPNFVKAYKRKGIYLGEQASEALFKVIQSIPVIKDIAEAYVESART